MLQNFHPSVHFIHRICTLRCTFSDLLQDQLSLSLSLWFMEQDIPISTTKGSKMSLLEVFHVSVNDGVMNLILLVYYFPINNLTILSWGNLNFSKGVIDFTKGSGNVRICLPHFLNFLDFLSKLLSDLLLSPFSFLVVNLLSVNFFDE